jgi:hypothetical protein
MTAARFWELYGEALRGFHLREALPPRRGNSNYRDQTVRPVQTLCGAPAGTRDTPARDAGTRLHGPYILAHCCPGCRAVWNGRVARLKAQETGETPVAARPVGDEETS